MAPVPGLPLRQTSRHCRRRCSLRRSPPSPSQTPADRCGARPARAEVGPPLTLRGPRAVRGPGRRLRHGCPASPVAPAGRRPSRRPHVAGKQAVACAGAPARPSVWPSVHCSLRHDGTRVLGPFPVFPFMNLIFNEPYLRSDTLNVSF